jgi:hypothetical protein
MEILIITAILTAAFIGTHVCYQRFSAGGRLRRALRRAPRVSVADAPDGEVVRIVGRVRFADLEPLSAPVSNRRCAYYEIEVEERSGVGRNQSWSKVLEHKEHLERFVIEDETGRALVEPKAPRVVLNMDTHLSSGMSKDPPLELRSFLMVHGVATEGLLFNKTMQYTEGALEEGEQVTVLGRCRREPDPEPGAGPAGAGYRQVPLRLRIVEPGDGVPMVLSDDPSTLG